MILEIENTTCNNLGTGFWTIFGFGYVAEIGTGYYSIYGTGDGNGNNLN